MYVSKIAARLQSTVYLQSIKDYTNCPLLSVQFKLLMK